MIPLRRPRSSIEKSATVKTIPGDGFCLPRSIVGALGLPSLCSLLPGWDLTLPGMIVGEMRRITLPYTVAYDRVGDKQLQIPPFATMIYTVKLLSIT